MAYRRLAINHIDEGSFETAKQYLQKAIEYINRVSARERYLIRVYEYSILKDSADDAIEICKELLRNYPDDEEGKIMLGAIYRNLELWDPALEQFNNILESNKQSRFANVNIIYIYSTTGRFEEAKELLLKNRAQFINPALYHRYMAIILAHQGECDRALSELKEAQNILSDSNADANIEMLGKIYHIKGDFTLAGYYYRQLMEMEDTGAQAGGYFWMCNVYLTQGEYIKCRNEINLGLKHCRKYKLEQDGHKFLLFSIYLDLLTGNSEKALLTAEQIVNTESAFRFTDTVYIKEFALHLAGASYLQKGKIKEAKDTADKLEKLIKRTGNPKKIRLFYHLKALIYMAEGKNKEAVKLLEQSIPLLPFHINKWDNRAFYFEPLARAYHKTGNIKKTEEFYKKIQSLTMCRFMWGDIYARSFYQLAKIYREKGDIKEAIRQYKRFLNIWEKADPDIPLFVSARQELAALERSSF